jgi:hypothetical protein
LHYVRTHPGTSLSETLSPQSWLDFAEIVDRIESKQKRLKSPHECYAMHWNACRVLQMLDGSGWARPSLRQKATALPKKVLILTVKLWLLALFAQI